MKPIPYNRETLVSVDKLKSIILKIIKHKVLNKVKIIAEKEINN